MRIGVYICHCGGNISEVVDVKQVASFAERQPGVVIARDYEHMCSELGQKLILDDIKKYKLNRVVVSACSPQFHGNTFMSTLENGGLNPYVLEMANIREQCAWPHFDIPLDATEKAKGLTAMSIAKVKLDKPIEKKFLPIGKRVLIIGAGIAGIQAALDLADAGFEVYLVEKAPTIGGKMALLSRTFPTEDCAACILTPKMADVAAHPNIKLFTLSEIEKINGFLGNFKVTLNKKPSYVNEDKCASCGICTEKCPQRVSNEFNEGLNNRKAIYIPSEIAVPYKYLIDEKACLYLTKGRCRVCEKSCPQKAIEFNQKPKKINITVDTIIVTTGYDIFDATQKKEYGYGRYENVITALELERMIVYEASGKPLRKIGNRVAFIQCVGSRDEQIGREYCSRICCMYATKLSQLLKRGDPKRDVYVFYTDLRAYGKGFEEYYKRAQRSGVKFIRGRVAEVVEDFKSKKVTLRVEDTLTRQIIESEFDLVVLSVGLGPNAGTNKIAEILKLAKSPDGFLQEAHPKFKPVDTLIEGVFIAGCVQGPKDIPDTVAQAGAASSRAIRLMNKKKFEMTPIKAFVHEELCDGCRLCEDHCPVNAISVSKTANINEALCKGCGSCIAYCPKDALDLSYYENSQLLAQIKAGLENKKGDEVRVLIFADDTCTYRLADNVGTSKIAYSPIARIIRIPSGSRVTPKLMLNAFKFGADGVFIGECEQKASPYPNSVAEVEKNVEAVRNILEEEEIEPERVRWAAFVTVMLKGFTNNVNTLADFVKKAGLIPNEKRQNLGENISEKLFAKKVSV
ncbi:hydrogenase iron-sulfur subunit [Candidatus Aerophobetes bacterium]|nr:hydrogenase iron-sulfur subunit [Candidatus Aerophobetes bacterium]